MLNLDAFELGFLQTVSHLLNLYEAEGVTDIRFVRKGIAQHAEGFARRRRLGERRGLPSNPKGSRPKGACPSCGARAVTPMEVDGEVVMACRACRWSKMVSLEGV